MILKNKGFTLIELMLSVALISLVAGIGVPVYQAFQDNTDLDTALEVTVSGLRRAQTLATAMSGDSPFGVKIQNSEITVFKGANFATRDAGYDEVFEISAVVGSSGIDEVVFAKFYGTPSATGSIVFSLASGNTKTITINEKGVVEF